MPTVAPHTHTHTQAHNPLQTYMLKVLSNPSSCHFHVPQSSLPGGSMSKEYTGAFLDLSGCAFKYRIRASVSPLPTSMIGPRMEAPILKVSRPVSACARCRNAKIRCDGKLPACSACERAGKSAECSSANDRFAKGKERSYVASLESRIEKLEKQLASKRGHGALDQSERKHHRSISDTAPRSSEALDVDDLVSDFGYLCVHRHYPCALLALTIMQICQRHGQRVSWIREGDVIRKASFISCLQRSRPKFHQGNAAGA